MQIGTRVVGFGFVAMVSAFLPACGSSSGGSCGNGSACGGNIVGTWKITESCVSATASMANIMDCPTAKISDAHESVTGTVSYNADMTYTVVANLKVTASIFFPVSCLVFNGVTVTCDQLNQQFAANPMPGITIHCVGSSDCACSEVVGPMDNNETGTYTTAAGVVTEASSDGATSKANYCVMGNTMTLVPQSDPAETTMGSVVLTKS